MNCPLCNRECLPQDYDSRFVRCYCGGSPKADGKDLNIKFLGHLDETGNDANWFHIFDYSKSHMSIRVSNNNSYWEVLELNKQGSMDIISKGHDIISPTQAHKLLQRYSNLKAFT